VTVPDPTARLRFDGDPAKLTRALGKVGSVMDDTTKGIQKGASKAEDALQGVQRAADNLKPVTVNVAADTARAETTIRGVGDDVGPVTVEAKADISKAEAKIKGIEGKPVEIPVKADTSKAEAQIRGMGKKAGAEAGRDAGEGFGGKFLGALAGVGFVSTISGIVSDAFSQAADKAKVTANLQNQMGISPEDARKYGDRVGRAYAGGLGESKDQIAGVYSTLSSDVSDWAQRTETAQDRVAHRQTKVVQGFGVDTVAAIGAASSAVTNKLVPSFEDAQDLLVTGYQILGSRGDDWADTLKEYSGYFKNLGFDGATALGTINQMLKAGARDTDYAADAFKEFNIRIIDGTELTKGALKALGKDFANIPQEIVKGGPAALGALDKVIDKIKTIKDPIKQNEIGVALFGTQWEDTMKQVVSSVDISTAAIGGKFQGAVDKMTVATDTNVERFQRRWESGLSVVGDKIAGWANEGAAIADAFSNHLSNQLHGVEMKGGKAFQGIADALHKLNEKGKQTKIQIQAEADWQKVQDIHNRLMKLPRNTPVKVQGMTQEAERQLQQLGWTVKHLPNGVVSVSANTKPATDQAAATMRWLNSLHANISVGVVGPGKNYALKNIKGGMAAFAEGGVVNGPGGVDNVPIWATKGEHVTAERYASRPDNARILDAINSGRDWRSALPAAGAIPVQRGSSGGGPRVISVAWLGNTDSAFATAFMRMHRDGLIQIGVG
jgi:hypothetical protein